MTTISHDPAKAMARAIETVRQLQNAPDVMTAMRQLQVNPADYRIAEVAADIHHGAHPHRAAHPSGLPQVAPRYIQSWGQPAGLEAPDAATGGIHARASGYALC